MDGIEKNVKSKFERFGIEGFDDLKSKTKQWLIEIEEYMNKCNNIRKENVEKYKKYKVTIKGIANNVKISRQSIYNYEIILKYIEESIREFDAYDTFAESNIQRVTEQRDEIKRQFDKMVGELIEMHNLEQATESLMAEIKKLAKEKEDLNIIIRAKEKEVSKLKAIIKENGPNIIELNISK